MQDVPRCRSPRSLQAAELLLSAHDHPAQFSLSHSFSLEGEPRVLMTIAPPATPPNRVVSMTIPAVPPANPGMQMHPAYPPAFCIASSRTLVHTAAAALPPSPNSQLAQQPQAPLAGGPFAAPGPTPVQRRKARSEGPGKQGWKQEEDQAIVRMVEGSGQKWSSIAAVLPGRTDDAVRNRYLRLQRKHAQGEKKGDMWTAEEDKRIREAVLHHGLKWHEIAAELPGRSANAVRNRYLRCTSAPRPEATSVAAMVAQPHCLAQPAGAMVAQPSGLAAGVVTTVAQPPPQPPQPPQPGTGVGQPAVAPSPGAEAEAAPPSPVAGVARSPGAVLTPPAAALAAQPSDAVKAPSPLTVAAPPRQPATAQPPAASMEIGPVAVVAQPPVVVAATLPGAVAAQPAVNAMAQPAAIAAGAVAPHVS